MRVDESAGSAGGGTGGDAVVDDDHGAARQRNSWTRTPVPGRLAGEFCPLLLFHRSHLGVSELRVLHDGVVDDSGTVFADGTEREFGLVGDTERTKITSSGAPSAAATSNATGTPPRGTPSTTTSAPRRDCIRAASRRPASLRS